MHRNGNQTTWAVWSNVFQRASAMWGDFVPIKEQRIKQSQIKIENASLFQCYFFSSSDASRGKGSVLG